MAERLVKRARIVQDLKKLGLRPGDVVMVHSALSSLGKVEGGARTVIEALLEVLTPSGTLMMLTFASPGPFHIKKTPSGLGAVTEAFRKWPGVMRSLHPSHSVAALGPRAQDLIKDYAKSPTAAGCETPYGRLIEMDGKILLLGVDNDRSTVMHTLEEYVEAPYLSEHKATYLDEKGKPQTITMKLYPGPHRDFIGLHPLFREKGVETVGKVGNAVARLIDARKMRDVVLAAFKKDPALVLCDNPECGDCVMQRRKIRLARLKQEDFILSALASSVSQYPDEIAAELNRAGVYDLVVDRLYGAPLLRLDAKKLKRAAATFKEEGIKVGAVAAPADLSAIVLGGAEGTKAGESKFDASAGIAALFRCKTLLMPMPGDPKGMLRKVAGKMQLLFENTTQTSNVLAAQLKGAGNVLAFNPAAFALVGENPFLRSYSRTDLRHHIGMLFLSDATFGGQFTLPGRGNGEVKEMVSILRCKSFAGRVVIATGPGGPCFRELVESFWKLLETM